jgi:hypothetical protein
MPETRVSLVEEQETIHNPRMMVRINCGQVLRVVVIFLLLECFIYVLPSFDPYFF